MAMLLVSIPFIKACKAASPSANHAYKVYKQMFHPCCTRLVLSGDISPQ